jgi:serine/threonine protein kinase
MIQPELHDEIHRNPEMPDKGIYSASRTISDYDVLLENNSLKWHDLGLHLKVGEIAWTQGWMLHLSVIKTQVGTLFTKVIPLLAGEKIPFLIVKSIDTAEFLLSGHGGLTELGKIMTVFPSGEEQAVYLAKMLIRETMDFKGPEILTDYHLGGAVYTRYGACNALLVKNAEGGVDKCMYNDRNELVRDTENIPFKIPNWIRWPYLGICPLDARQKDSRFIGKYRILETLKFDAKGSVLKAIWMKKWYRPKYCVIKQGRNCMDSDWQGRDITDKIKWQYAQHEILKGHIPLPAPIELFSENGDTFFAMDYIVGSSLTVKVMDLFAERPWGDLPDSTRKQLVQYGQAIISSIKKMHTLGYIHRDISPANFIINRTNKVEFLDLELAYFVNSNYPDPPFAGGTFGYRAPELAEDGVPGYECDIFSLGALLVFLLTGLPPGRFSIDSPEHLRRQLNHYINNDFVDKVLARCLHPEPGKRPRIEIIENELLSCFSPGRQTISAQPTADSRKFAIKEGIAVLGACTCNTAILRHAVQHAINGLTSSNLVNKQGLWFDRLQQKRGEQYALTELTEVNSNLYNGLSGIVYTLNRAKNLDFDLSPCHEIYSRATRLIWNTLSASMDNRGGLFYGPIGNALAIMEDDKCQVLDADHPLRAKLKLLALNNPGMDLTLSRGKAGQGLFVTNIVQKFDLIDFKPQLHTLLDYFLTRQDPDGSWDTISTSNNPSNNPKITGLFNGSSGVLYFLLNYINTFPDKNVEIVVLKGMDWLIRQSRKSRGRMFWYYDPKTKEVSGNMESGMAGIAMVFILAFHHFRDPNYKKIAQDILFSFPSPMIAPNLSLSTGVSGISKAYLKAYQVFGDSTLLERSHAIFDDLLHQYKYFTNDACYCVMDETPISTAGLFNGNAGIIDLMLDMWLIEND